jgi:hypothetical protein
MRRMVTRSKYFSVQMALSDSSLVIWSGKRTETKLRTRAVHQLCVLENEKNYVSDTRNRVGWGIKDIYLI